MNDESFPVSFITHYGYVAVLLGTLIEGETVVMVAGFLAHQGYLSIPLIIICAIVGSFISDQGLFFLSRLRGRNLLGRFPKIQGRVMRMMDKASSRPIWLAFLALGMRFMYGLRSVTPVFLGISPLPTPRFVILNAFGAVLWASLYSGIGYGFASILDTLFGSFGEYEVFVAGFILASSIVFTFLRFWCIPYLEKRKEDARKAGKKA